MKTETKIIICGDLCPTKDTQSLFEKQDPILLFNDVLQEFKKADLLIGNLEFVLTDNPKPIKKAGPILYGKTNYINIFKNAGFHLMSLANNHIKDCGEEGVKSSIETCINNKIDVLGVGKNIEEAKKPYVKIINGFKIGIIAFAEKEFNIASDTEYGSNFLDPFEDLDAIAKLKDEVDFLLVIYHGGIEYYEYPSPLLQKKCRKFIEKGADLVTCQHSHCIGTIEDFQSKKIIYGQGNTVFGYRPNNNSWNQGLLLEIDLLQDNQFKVRYSGITATENGINLMTSEENEKLIKNFEERSKLVYDEKFIKTSWQKFCHEKKSIYFPQYLALNRYFIHLNRIFKNYVVSLLYSTKYIRSSHNILRCESHNEVVNTILEQHLKKDK
jgi:poly-gamma-glutamate capsule biosynthesis protein CapA/YwtB (metallophosphatase superfamily)